VKFRVDRDVLAEAVTWAARGLPNRPSLPVLAGLVLEAGSEAAPDELTLSGFDYEVSSRVQVPADISDPGKALVSGRLLAEIARSLPAQPVDFVTDGGRVTLTCQSARFTLLTMPIEDYPALPAMPTTSGRIDGETFAAAVNQVVVAAGRDDTLPVLTGVLFEIADDEITLWTTDRYRLAVRTFPWTPADGNAVDAVGGTSALVPARTLNDIAKSLSGGDVNVAFAAGGTGDGLAGFEGSGSRGTWRTTTRLLDGEFPKVKSLFPAETLTTARIETAPFLEALRRVALVADRQTPVRLTFAEGELVLDAGASDEAQASEALDAALDGEPISIAFNPTYLVDGLSALGAPTAVMSFTMPTKPAVLTGAADDGDATASSDAQAALQAAYRYLLMPIRLSG
jgi:DNA polymerase-3 subunit beta